jgi:predicted RNase H-like HicB family nuclease
MLEWAAKEPITLKITHSDGYFHVSSPTDPGLHIAAESLDGALSSAAIALPILRKHNSAAATIGQQMEDREG